MEKRFEAGSLSPLPAYRGVLLKASIFSNCMSELSWNGVGVKVSSKMTRPARPSASRPRLSLVSIGTLGWRIAGIIRKIPHKIQPTQ